MPDTWTVEQAADKIGDDERHGTQAALQLRLDKGKGIAVYENHDLGHPMLGHAMGFTYGTPEAQFECDAESLPERCPDGLAKDITGGINWRYMLVAVVPPKEANDATA